VVQKVTEIMYFLFNICLFIVPAGVLGNLDDVLSNYDSLHHLDISHRIVKRDVTNGRPMVRQVEFDGLGKHFNLHLTRKSGILSSDFRLLVANSDKEDRVVDIVQDSYEGYMLGEAEHSHVSAIWEDETSLIATITAPDDVYRIEPSWRFMADNFTDKMIIYRDTDVNMEEDVGKNFCDYVDMNKEIRNDLKQSQKPHQWDEEERQYQQQSGRKKRSAGGCHAPLKNTCQVKLVADFRFYKDMGQRSVYKTHAYLIGLMERVNHIYRNTAFGDEENCVTGIGFEIKEILIHEEPTPANSNNYLYNVEQTWETKDLLEMFSRETTNRRYCLAHLFTYTAFDNGVLGLAYIASPRIYSVGGLCSLDYTKNGHKLFLNTGWSSSLNRHQRRLLTQEADLVTAHEFGHNFGSEHDPDTADCAPSDFQGGKHIMWTYSVSGYGSNNRVFSKCSRLSIGRVLDQKRTNCFKERSEAYCGDYAVEGEEEQCDAGLHNLEDPCCDMSELNKCKLKNGARCSDGNSMCCQNCQVAPAGLVCNAQLDNSTSCDLPATCDGLSDECPDPEHQPDGSECLEGGTCKAGRCVDFCETNNSTSCVCDEVAKSCLTCCINNATGRCEAHTDQKPLPDGMPCVQGYCTEGKCIKQVQDLVQRLWDIIENLTPSRFVEFMRANIVGFVLIFSLLVWIPASCAVSYVDRKRAQKEEETVEWHKSTNPYLVKDTTDVKIRKGSRVYRHREITTPQPQKTFTHINT